MTPKEKAKELVDKYMFMEVSNYVSKFEIKLCAIISVNEILKSGIEIDYYFDKSIGYYISYLEYYGEVKHEIENL